MNMKYCIHCRYDFFADVFEPLGEDEIVYSVNKQRHKSEKGTYICLAVETRCIAGESVEYMYSLSRHVKAVEGMDCPLFKKKRVFLNPSPKKPFKVVRYGQGTMKGKSYDSTGFFKWFGIRL